MNSHEFNEKNTTCCQVRRHAVFTGGLGRPSKRPDKGA